MNLNDSEEKKTEQLHGKNWITRFYCRQIRPRLFKKQHDKLKKLMGITAKTLKAELKKSIIDQAVSMGLVNDKTIEQLLEERFTGKLCKRAYSDTQGKEDGHG